MAFHLSNMISPASFNSITAFAAVPDILPKMSPRRYAQIVTKYAPRV